MKLRTMHHLACSGGTIISKATQAMIKTLVISEVHPDELHYRFNPFDPSQLLLAQTKLRNNSQLRRSIFLRRIAECVELAESEGLTLVLRDHTHYDYAARGDIAHRPALIDTLSSHYDTCPLLTVRDPLEAYMSLQSNGWDKAISSFNDYCTRYEKMVQHYQDLNCGMLRYEDFCRNPDDFMRKVCTHLDLGFNPEFQNVMHKIPMTGDSGRGKNFGAIKVLTPKPVSEDLAQQALHSAAYQRLAARFDYPTPAFR